MVFALAHATGKSGRFTLLERWRNNERQLAPNENPLKVGSNANALRELGKTPNSPRFQMFHSSFTQILMKWGEYSNDVQFILQWNESTKYQTSIAGHKSKVPSASPSLPLPQNAVVDTSERQRESQKSFLFRYTVAIFIVRLVYGTSFETQCELK